MEKTDISIIIRTKNEERWINRCISQILNQKISKTYEIILVDSGSTDKTIEKAKKFDVSIINIDKYTPGFSINQGVERAKGNLIVLISAHAIPYGCNWLSNLIKPIYEEENVVATYGRQIPAEWSDPNDIRDLSITFGLEDKLQKKDTFFHNANSAFLKSTWKTFKFDEFATNIEDRLWAEELIRNNLHIKYVANSIIYHWHGIHHYGNFKRAKSTAKVVLESTSIFKNLEIYTPEISTITAIIPDASGMDIEHKVFCIKRLVDQLSKTKFNWNLIFFTPYKPFEDNEKFPNIKIIWVERNSDYLLNLNMISLIKYCVDYLEKLNKDILEIVSIFNIYYILRSYEDIDKAVKIFEKEDFDLLTTIYAESTKDIHNIDGLSIRENDINFKSKDNYKYDNFSNIITSLNRNIQNGFLSIPGYITLFHASKIRDEEFITSFRIGYLKIEGYEKMLKVTNKEIIDNIKRNLKIL